MRRTKINKTASKHKHHHHIHSATIYVLDEKLMKNKQANEDHNLNNLLD